MTILEAKNRLKNNLMRIYDEREAGNITEMVLEKITGLERIQMLLQKNITLEIQQINLFEKLEADLLTQKPVQYVLGEAWFMGLDFYVEEGVLIPRPETEELVQWILETTKEKNANVLDIGTGSGCIAISLAKLQPNLKVWAIDKSEAALEIARKNNERQLTAVTFLQTDILALNQIDVCQKLDVIISNPPYIKELERKEMSANVLDFEPEMALFVPNEKPFLFYEKIALLATKALNANGFLFFEINEMFGKEIVSLLCDLGFSQFELKKDLQGKDRMVKATWLVN